MYAIKYVIAYFVLFNCVQQVYAQDASIEQKDCLFDWAQKNYSNLFSPADAISQVYGRYFYRYYQSTNSYVGVASDDNHVYYLSPDGTLWDVGDAYPWLSAAKCRLVDLLIKEMDLPHEAEPNGVSKYWDWKTMPVKHSGTHPYTFTAMTLHGQVYEDDSNRPPTSNTRVQLKGAKSCWLSRKDQQWHILQEPKSPDGLAFTLDYSSSMPADMRYEPDGTISVKPGGEYNFHFYPMIRAEIDPDDIDGIFTTVQARLIVEDINSIDDRAGSRYIVNMGADYWRDKVIYNKNADFSCRFTDKALVNQDNCSIGQGRFKYVTNEWKPFNMIVISDSYGDNYLPPDISGTPCQ